MNSKLDEALGLFPSVIKCGEQWSPVCQAVLESAKAELAALRASAAPEEGRKREESAAKIIHEARKVYENHQGDGAWLAMERAYFDLISAALSPSPSVGTGTQQEVIGQHLSWLFLYMQTINEKNWRDTRDNAIRQLEQLSLLFPGRAISSAQRQGEAT